MKKYSGWLSSLLLVGLLAVAGCGGEAGEASGGDYAPTEDDDYDYPGQGGADASPSSQDVGEPPPPEQEVEFQAPSAGERYVFVLHPSRDQVIQIDAVRLDIDLVEVGLAPTVLATAPGRDVALVVNAGGGDLSVVDARTPGATEVTNVPALPGVNRLVLAPDGRHGVAFFDYDAAAAGDPVGSLQAVTLVRTVPGEVASVDVGTGFRPSKVEFSSDGRAAYVVTDEGVTRIPLTGDLPEIGVLPTIPVSTNPLAAALEREVAITPDGAFAVVRTLGQSSLAIVDLQTRALTEVTLAGEPTDVDLTPDGGTVLVMLRGQAQAAVGNLRELLENPEALSVVDLAGMPLGAAAMAPDGTTALLFTTVDDVEVLARLDMTTRAVAPILLQKTVKGVQYAPDGSRAFVLHRTSGAAAWDGMPLDDFVDASFGYSVVDVEAAVARLQLTDHEPGPFAFTPGSERLYVLLPDAHQVAHAIADVDLRTLMGTSRPLASLPQSVQPVPAAGKVAVSQEHPTGRITFFDVATGIGETLTGFELGGLID